MLKDQGATPLFVSADAIQANECAGFATCLRAQADLLEERLIWLAVNGAQDQELVAASASDFLLYWDLSDDIHVVKNHWVG